MQQMKGGVMHKAASGVGLRAGQVQRIPGQVDVAVHLRGERGGRGQISSAFLAPTDPHSS